MGRLVAALGNGCGLHCSFLLCSSLNEWRLQMRVWGRTATPFVCMLLPIGFPLHITNLANVWIPCVQLGQRCRLAELWCVLIAG
jgi:hypothetical protein